jgi:hypothetical protein
MSTRSQRRANRENAQSSTGPITPEGKEKSSLNATRIGLFAADVTLTLTPDELKIYAGIVQKHVAGLDPKGTEEKWLAERIGRIQFSLDRLRDLEINLLVDPESETANRIIRSANPLMTLSIYEGRLSRERDKARKHLQGLQDARKPLDDKDRYHAETVGEACNMLKEPFDPKEFGFDFSTHDLMLKYNDRRLWELAQHLVMSPETDPFAIKEFKAKIDFAKDLSKVGK